MATDPASVYRSTGDHVKNFLKISAPELHDALERLAGVRRAAEADQPQESHIGCVLHRYSDPAELPRVAGRLTLNGMPACVECITTKSSRPGGYPLAIVNDAAEYRRYQSEGLS